MLINASKKFKPLKKSKGSKRKEVDEANRLDIVATLTAYKDNDYAKVFDKEFFYFNKQAIMLTNIDDDGNFFEQKLKINNGQLLIDNDLFTLKIDGGQLSIDNGQLTTGFESLEPTAETAKRLKDLLKSLNYKEHNLQIHTPEMIYGFDPEKESLTELSVDNCQLTTNNYPLSTINYLGCGKIAVKSSLKKATKKLPERIEISVELTPDYQKDYEIIPFHKNETANQQAIASFMAKYISKPFQYLDNVVGVELNFNKVFYKPEILRPVSTILAEIEVVDKQLNELESELMI